VNINRFVCFTQFCAITDALKFTNFEVTKFGMYNNLRAHFTQGPQCLFPDLYPKTPNCTTLWAHSFSFFTLHGERFNDNQPAASH